MSDEYTNRPFFWFWENRLLAYSLNDFRGERLSIMPLPDAIVVHLHDLDIRWHKPVRMKIVGTDVEPNAWGEVARNFGICPRLFEDTDGTRALAFHVPGDLEFDLLAYEWNIDTDDPTRSGWKPVRYSDPMDELPCKIVNRPQLAVDALDSLIHGTIFYEPALTAAAVDDTKGDYMGDYVEDIEVLITWLRNIQSHLRRMRG